MLTNQHGESTMSNTVKKNQEISLQALYEELELRYGPAMAQEIIDQVKKTEDQDNKPEYMAVKALSEAVEIFRVDAQGIVKKLKNIKSNDLPDDIANLEEKRLQNELKRIFSCYWIAQHSFYTSYKRAIKGAEVPVKYRYDRYTKPEKMAA